VIDHVTIRVSDLAASRAFYGRAFQLVGFPGRVHEGDGFVEWHDFSLAAADGEHPVTRRLHAGFGARSREDVDRWWHGLTAAGHPDAGAPGPRPEYGPDYYGAFVLDPDGNSVEAVHDPPPPEGNVLDHLWLRVRSLASARSFYDAVAPVVGFQVRDLPGRVQERDAVSSFSLLEGEPTQHVHLAFAAGDRETVEAFHRAGVEAGYRSNGEPGQRPEYHAGYVGAYLLDPDGNNVEAVFHDRG
jgi:catechol 2,3-dioxygenase-like lactoylglutathione lyase family enzyme